MKTIIINLLRQGYESIAFSLCCGFIASFFIPIKGFLLFTVFVVFADTISGVLASKKQAIEINSRGLYRTIEKIIVYFLSILIFEGAKQTFSIPLNISYMVASMIAVVELTSISENVKKITGVNLGTFILRIFKR
jgi:uncharacterized membrane protein